jgi:hypothetical protein
MVGKNLFQIVSQYWYICLNDDCGLCRMREVSYNISSFFYTHQPEILSNWYTHIYEQATHKYEGNS